MTWAALSGAILLHLLRSVHGTELPCGHVRFHGKRDLTTALFSG
jgi:hypothetical protein